MWAYPAPSERIQLQQRGRLRSNVERLRSGTIERYLATQSFPKKSEDIINDFEGWPYTVRSGGRLRLIRNVWVENWKLVNFNTSKSKMSQAQH